MPRRYDERGIALASPLAFASVAAVVLAAVAFVTTSGEPDATGPADATGPPVASGPSDAAPLPSQTRSNSHPPQPREAEKPTKPATSPAARRPPQQPQVRRSSVYVEVYNNSGISGLAGSTASALAGAGWQVVGSDNWYGTIPASTVYYPDRLRGEAKLMARDLAITRVQPSISPMRFDRLTVILTADYS